jgi:hypothetical protein
MTIISSCKIFISETPHSYNMKRFDQCMNKYNIALEYTVIVQDKSGLCDRYLVQIGEVKLHHDNLGGFRGPFK